MLMVDWWVRRAESAGEAFNYVLTFRLFSGRLL